MSRFLSSSESRFQAPDPSSRTTSALRASLPRMGLELALSAQKRWRALKGASSSRIARTLPRLSAQQTDGGDCLTLQRASRLPGN